MEIVAIISLLIYGYALYCICREMYQLNLSSFLTDEKKQVRLPILLYFLVMYLVLIYWIFSRKGFPFGFHQNIIEENFWLFLLIASQVSTSITRHFRKERTNESLILNYKKEIKRTMGFRFDNNSEFNNLAKLFIKNCKKNNIKVFRISNNVLDIEHLKYLKKGQEIPFGSNSYLIKNSDLHIHKYIYKNTDALVFDPHLHKLFSEGIKPLINDIELYIWDKNNKMIKILLKVGQYYLIPKGVRHAVIFSLSNEIELDWE